MPVLESSIERACREIAKEQGCILLKIQGTKGWPDRLLIQPGGDLIFLEFKRPGAQPTPLQQHVLKTLKTMGHRAEVVDSREQFRCLLKY